MTNGQSAMSFGSDWSFTTHAKASSSSDLASEAARSGAPEGRGFLVLEQTAGRGRRGARWQSAQGGMYFSMLLRPIVPPQYWFVLSFIAALAIRDELGRLLGEDIVTLKWPNDVLAGTGATRGKICGILLEASGDQLIIGTGVNIASVETPDGAKQPAVAITDFDVTGITPEALATAYQQNFSRRYIAFNNVVASVSESNDPASVFAPVRDEWLRHTAHQNARLVVTHDGYETAGQFVTLGADGTMQILDDAGRTHHISTGDVALIGTI